MTNLRTSISSGIFYTGIAKYSGVIISIIIGAVLARLLSPEEFGIVALVAVFVGFFHLLSDFGIGPAVIQNQSLDKEDIKSIFTFSIFVALLMALLFFFGSTLIAQFYNETELIRVSKFLSIAVFFNALQIVPKSIIQKALRFKLLGIVTLVIQVLSGVIAIILAYAGWSYYALVTQSIIAGGASFAIFYLITPLKIKLKIQWISLKKILKFSIYQFMFNLVNYFSRNSDNILIGKFMGSASLGYYDKAYKLMLLPVSNLTHVITPVLMPVLSKHSNDKKMVYDVYLKIIKILAIIGFPLSVVLYFSAGEIINLLYGPQWDQSVPVFKLLALTIGYQMLLSSSGSIFQAVNRTDLMFLSGIFGTVILVSCVLAGIFIGDSLISVGYGIVIGYALYFIVIFVLLIHYALQQKMKKFFITLIYPVITAIVLSFFLFLLEKYFFDKTIFNLSLKLLFSAIVFLILLWIKVDYRNRLKLEITKLLNRRISK